MNNIISLKERQQARSRNRNRKRAESRLEEREHIRLELKTREYIQTTHQAIDLLLKGSEQVADETTQTMIVVPLDRARVQAIKASADLSLRLLAKVLPDLKAVEHISTPGDGDPRQLSTGELMALVEKLGQRPTVQIEDAQIVEDPGW